MNILKYNFAKKFLAIFFISYIGIALGYSNIKTPYAHHKFIDNDSYIYIDLARNGLDAITNDHRATRLVIPILAHEFSKLNNLQGQYNTPQFNIFFISLVFFIITTITLYAYVNNLFGANIALIAIASFFLHFYTMNMYFLGLPDSLEFLLSLFLFIVLQRNKLWLLIPLFFVVALNRESFLVFAAPVVLLWPLFNNVELPKIRYLFFSIFCSIIFLAIIFFIKNYIQDGIGGFSDKLLSFIDVKKFKMFFQINQLINLLYFTLILVPLGLIGLKNERCLLYSVLTILVIYIFLSGIFVGSGAALGRYIFSSAGPILIIGQSIFIADKLNLFKNK